MYAVALGRPEGGKLTIKALASKPAHYPGEMGSVQRLGSPGKLEIVRDENGLTVSLPGNGNPNYATALKIIPQA